MRLPFRTCAVLMIAAACGPTGASSSDPTTSNEPALSPPPRDGDVAGPPDARAAAGADGGDTEPPPVPYQAFDVNHVLSTGQSNAVALGGVPPLSVAQPFDNLMFDVGVMTASSCDGDGCTRYDAPSKFVPLVEGDTFFYPTETMSSGLANEIAKLAHARVGRHDVLVTLHGRSGNSYWCLRKGGCDWWQGRGYLKAFDDGMKQVADAKRLAEAAGKSYVVRAVTAIHGEHDHYAYAAGDSVFPLPGTDGGSVVRDYADALLEWQRDYEASVRAITHQALPVPLFVSQYSHWNNTPHTKIAFMQLDAHRRAPDKVVLVGPTYALEYDVHCLHFTSESERRLGEYFAKAYARVVIEGRRWEPLTPKTITRQGNVIRATFHVPKPPLVLDTTRVDDPGNYGFEVSDDSGAPPPITSVAIVAPDTVEIRLGRAPTGANLRLRYAYTFTGCAGPRSIARGNLRDSDDTPSQSGHELFDWAVHFDEPVK